jgi:SAM-dependent methyltransferase
VDINTQEIQRLAQQDRTSWWIRGRRELIGVVLKGRAAGVEPAAVADLGCGAGGMFEPLQRFGGVIGVDISPTAVTACRSKAYRGMVIGTLEQLPLHDESLCLAGMTDVLEHVEDHERVLHECLRVLKPGGFLLLTVPALPWLYSAHDLALGHFRRYTGEDVRRLATRCGFEVERITYFNTLLLPVILVFRTVSRIWRRASAEADPLSVANPWNWLAYQVFSAERALITFLDMPVGLSLLCLVRKPGGDRAPAGAHGAR